MTPEARAEAIIQSQMLQRWHGLGPDIAQAIRDAEAAARTDERAACLNIARDAAAARSSWTDARACNDIATAIEKRGQP